MRAALLSRNIAALLLSIAACAVAADATVSPAPPPVLREGAVMSKKAGMAVMLAVVRAGRRLVGVGERGIILLSDDNGVSWRQASVPVQASLTAVRFDDDHTGWAAGHLGVILKTEDGGTSWRLQLDGIRAATLQADGLRSAGDDRSQRLADQWIAEGPDKPFFDLDFADNQHGFAVGAYNMACTTSDGGKTWLPLSSRLPNPQGLHLYAVRVRGSDVFIAGEQGLLLHSADGGSSFQTLPSPYKGSFFGLLVTRSGALLAYGLRGSLFRTTDFGASWRKIETHATATIGTGIERDDGQLVLLTQTGDSLTSRDDGASFKLYPAATPAPTAAAAIAPDGQLVLATLRGLRRQPTP